MRRLWIGILLLAIVAVIIWIIVANVSWNEHPNRLVLYGNVDIREVDISFRVLGRVKDLFFDEGDPVQTGDLMATLDPAPYTDVLEQTVAQIESARATYENADKLYLRRKELIKNGSVSQEDYDQAEANWKTARGNLDLAKAQYETALTNLNDTKVYAPTDGWILTRIREPGSVVQVSDPVLTLSVKSPVWIRAYVSEPHLGFIYPNMAAEVHTDKEHGRIYQGYIGFISPMAEFTPKTVETTQLRTDLVYRLRVIVENPDEYLRQGMPVTVILKK